MRLDVQLGDDGRVIRKGSGTAGQGKATDVSDKLRCRRRNGGRMEQVIEGTGVTSRREVARLCLRRRELPARSANTLEMIPAGLPGRRGRHIEVAKDDRRMTREKRGGGFDPLPTLDRESALRPHICGNAKGEDPEP